jgi:hypothetical protein
MPQSFLNSVHGILTEGNTEYLLKRFPDAKPDTKPDRHTALACEFWALEVHYVGSI